MNRLLLIYLAFGPALCQAEPYWVSWESGWPEEQGWTWGATDPGPERWLDDDTLYIDSRAAVGLAGGYYRTEPGAFSLEPGETFVAQWRVNVWETTFADPGLGVWADDQYAVSFSLGTDRIYSDYEPGVWAPFAAGQFHDFRVESDNFRTYWLYIDGAPVLDGAFFDSLLPGSTIDWGDLSSSRGLGQWDYVEYGIVPEPSILVCAWVCFSSLLLLKRSGGALRVFSTEEELR
jgi:hypothetical protein